MVAPGATLVPEAEESIAFTEMDPSAKRICWRFNCREGAPPHGRILTRRAADERS